ncbi:uncharacterized protein LOC125500598 [Athalia rosae]|uniref:uncharacterized protein LOC125500598 n=1 Tax=Athalia rosae TaxID=37344 RepID=UPI002034182B|nr:uncharacterized protein LOC125500598 [Athalia rosae]
MISFILLRSVGRGFLLTLEFHSFDTSSIHFAHSKVRVDTCVCVCVAPGIHERMHAISDGGGKYIDRFAKPFREVISLMCVTRYSLTISLTDAVPSSNRRKENESFGHLRMKNEKGNVNLQFATRDILGDRGWNRKSGTWLAVPCEFKQLSACPSFFFFVQRSYTGIYAKIEYSFRFYDRMATFPSVINQRNH